MKERKKEEEENGVGGGEESEEGCEKMFYLSLWVCPGV